MAKSRKSRAPTRVRIASKTRFAGEQPTPEQLRQLPFAISPIVEEGQVASRAFRRQPLYMTLSKTSDELTREEISALDVYRELHDRADRSFMKSCLDLDSDGRLRKPDAIVHVSNAVRAARNLIARFEAAIGPVITTLRGVALDDRTFSDLAMERFGSRTRAWILVDEPVMVNGRPLLKDGKPVLHAVEREELVPKSGRHRELIREEYRQAVKLLTAVIQDHGARSTSAEVWIGSLASGGCRIYRGMVGPKGAYRLRGNSHAITATLTELARGLNGSLEFPDYATAKAALTTAAAGILMDVDAPAIAD